MWQVKTIEQEKLNNEKDKGVPESVDKEAKTCTVWEM